MNYADRVKDTSASVGTGPITLFGAPITGFRSFLSAFPSGAVDVPYAIDDGAGNWEIGIGSFADSVLTRTQVLSSSSNGGLVDFVAGKKSVICTLPADLVESATNRSIAAASESEGHAEQTAQDKAQTGLDRAATAASATAAAADRVQTGLDRAATAADVVSTHADVVLTHADAAATAADRVQTGQDKAATAADRVQTGLDRSQTGTDAATATASEATALGYKNTAVDSANSAAGSAQSANDTLLQTQYARDQALAGLGAADNSQILSELGGQDSYAVDLAAQAVREMSGVPPGVDRTVSFMDEPMGLIGTMARTLEFCVKLVGVPASASAYGQKGDFAWDSGYLYICTAANTWKRVAIATW